MGPFGWTLIGRGRCFSWRVLVFQPFCPFFPPGGIFGTGKKGFGPKRRVDE